LCRNKPIDVEAASMQTYIANSIDAAMLGELTLVNSQRQFFANPDWLCHANYFASFRRTSRSWRITCSATSIWWANSSL